MANLTFINFLVPGVALALVVVFYRILWKRTNDKPSFKRLALSILLAGLLLNFAWEMLQMPFYKEMGLNAKDTLFCALASVADTVMVLLLYFSFALLFKDPFWARHLTFLRVFLVMLAGGVGAVLAELRHLSGGSWEYSSSMPLLPFIRVGLVPVLQFMILPVLSYAISIYWISKIRLAQRRKG